MTKLRKKMLDDMSLRNLGPGTRDAYIRCVAAFALYFHMSPDHLGTPEVRRFLLHLVDPRKLAPATRAVYHAALKFLYDQTLGLPEVMATVPRPRVPRQCDPIPLTRREARALLDALSNRPFDYTFFALMLATGLRISETAALRVGDIDRRAGLIRVRHGKGDKARSVMLSARTLRLLERYWTVERPRAPMLFCAQRLRLPGRVDLVHRWADHSVSSKTMGNRLRKLQRTRLALGRNVTSHDLRKTFATWLLEETGDLRLVQVLLGHASPQTTARYTQVHADRIAGTPSPFDRL